MIDTSVTVELGETSYKLSPTLDAMRQINSHFSSLVDCMQRVTRYDFEAMSFVISAGAGLAKQRVPEMEAQLVCRMEQAFEPIVKYIKILTRGGVDEEGTSQGEA